MKIVSEVLIDVTVADGSDRWRYMLGFKGGNHAPIQEGPHEK